MITWLNLDQTKERLLKLCDNPIGKANHEIHNNVQDVLETEIYENENISVKCYEFLYNILYKIAEKDFNDKNKVSNCTWSKLSSYYP